MRHHVSLPSQRLKWYQSSSRPKQKYNASKKIIRWATPPCRCVPHVVRHGREYGEFGVQALVDSHDRGNVATAIAVVWRRPNRDNRVLWEMILREDQYLRYMGKVHRRGTYLVSLIHQLMRASDELEPVDMVELSRDLISK